MPAKEIRVKAGHVILDGLLTIPENATNIILFVHGSGSSRFSPRNQAVAEEFNEYGLATLLFDLLTPKEEVVDMETRQIRFDIPLLADRVANTIDWLQSQPSTKQLSIGLIGSSTGAAAALVAAANKAQEVKAVVSRGGRPDLAGQALAKVLAPTLLIVGSLDTVVIGMNEQALQQLNCEKKLQLVSGATHLFEERGTLEQASHLARSWFLSYLGG